MVEPRKIEILHHNIAVLVEDHLERHHRAREICLCVIPFGHKIAIWRAAAPVGVDPVAVVHPLVEIAPERRDNVVIGIGGRQRCIVQALVRALKRLVDAQSPICIDIQLLDALAVEHKWEADIERAGKSPLVICADTSVSSQRRGIDPLKRHSIIPGVAQRARRREGTQAALRIGDRLAGLIVQQCVDQRRRWHQPCH